MKFLENIDKQIEKLQNKQLSFILDNKELSKFDKLKLIDKYNLFEKKSWLQHIFQDLELQWKVELLLKYNNESYFNIYDFIIGKNDYCRHETINLIWFIENLYDEYEDLNETIEVLFQINFPDKYEMKVIDAIEYICNWCFENKCISFKFDW